MRVTSGLFQQAARPTGGFTLIEVLIAMAITAFVSTIAYTSLSTVLTGVESTRQVSDRTYEVNRAWMIISRDVRQFVMRPIRDEFGESEPAMTGGPAARFALSFTRAGWHNPNEHLRSNLQRVNYRFEDNALWRDSYPVLDRAGDTSANSVKLLEGVEYMELAFLDSLASVETVGDGIKLDTRNWAQSWVVDTSNPGVELAPPVAIQIRLQLDDWGEMQRLYELPPL
jgi:general secretion pathway protein J